MKSGLRAFLKETDDYKFSIGAILIFAVLLFNLRNTKWSGAAAPVVVIIFLIIMAICIVVNSYIKFCKANEEGVTRVKSSEIIEGVLLPGGILLVSSFFLKPLGFYVVEFFVVIAMFALQDRVTKGKIDVSFKRIKFVALFALITVVTMFLIFDLLFGLPTPKGIFGF